MEAGGTCSGNAYHEARMAHSCLALKEFLFNLPMLCWHSKRCLDGFPDDKLNLRAEQKHIWM
jgi:hypothetical protein